MARALIAIQLEIEPSVLASGDAYRAHLEAVTARAVQAVGATTPRLIVFPEVAGHLALYALGPAATRNAKTLAAAFAGAAVRRPLDVLRGFATARRLDPRSAALAALAPDAERFWKSVFGPLARTHEAYIVAGTFVRVGAKGELTSSSLLFGPDGRLLATTDKRNLVPTIEDGSTSTALPLTRGQAEIPIVETGLGKIATLIGYDAHTKPLTQVDRFVPVAPQLQQRGGVDIVAHPITSPWPWQSPIPIETSGVTSGEMEQTDGLSGSLRQTPFARFGVRAQLVGRLLDQRYEGVSEIVEVVGSEVRVLARAAGHERGEHVVATV